MSSRGWELAACNGGSLTLPTRKTTPGEQSAVKSREPKNVCAYTHMYILIPLSDYLYMIICVHVCICIHMHKYLYVCTSACEYICMCMHTCVCMLTDQQIDR